VYISVNTNVSGNFDSYFLPTYYMPFSNYIRFKIKYALPVIASLLSYVVIGQLYTSSLSENDLVSSNGQMSAIKQDIFLHNSGKDTTKRVSIKLFNYNNDFFLFDNDGESYQLIKRSVNTGDTVSILHRTLFQSIIGFENESQIFKFQKSGDVLYNLDEAKQTFGAVNILETLVMVGLWILYFYFRYKLKLQKQPT
jgi:hypothetical protein